jgi:sugar fermentation stimulation protein A
LLESIFPNVYIIEQIFNLHLLSITMRYSLPIITGKLIRRYNRFLADVWIEGRVLTVHCPNSGSMAGLIDEGNPVRISGPYSGKRKYKYTLEQIQITRPDGRRVWVGINTMVPNVIVYEALKTRRVPDLDKYPIIQREVKLGDHSRIDFRLGHPGLPLCWIEVKNVTLVVGDPRRKEPLNYGNVAAFPDAVTVRGAKHLRELVERVRLGERAIMLYVIQRADGERFAPAEGYDPEYSKKLVTAEKEGVEVLPMRARVTKSGVWLGRVLGHVWNKEHMR